MGFMNNLCEWGSNIYANKGAALEDIPVGFVIVESFVVAALRHMPKLLQVE